MLMGAVLRLGQRLQSPGQPEVREVKTKLGPELGHVQEPMSGAEGESTSLAEHLISICFMVLYKSLISKYS